MWWRRRGYSYVFMCMYPGQSDSTVCIARLMYLAILYRRWIGGDIRGVRFALNVGH